MRLYRCFHDDELDAGQTILLSEEESRHLGGARRVGTGDTLSILNGRGVEASAEVESSSRKGMILRVTSIARAEPRPTERRVLACALTKSSSFDDMLQRAVELGMTDFWPLMTERTIVELDERRADKKADRWRRLFVEGLKQCERLWLPEVAEPRALDELGEALAAESVVPILLAERSPEAGPLPTVLATRAGRSHAFLVGPEGGWSPQEREAMHEWGWGAASLTGEAILRTETAALAALAIAMVCGNPTA